MKQTVKNTIAVAVGIMLSTAVGVVIEANMQQDLVYKIKDLPAFAEVQDISPNTYAPMVRLEDDDGQFFCSGTVISDNYVLTAAHCLMKRRGLVPGMRSDTFHVVSIKSADGVIQTVKVKAAAVNTRADYALVKGDFKDFTKARILTNPRDLPNLVGPLAACGFPWGSISTCYPTGNHLSTYFEHFSLSGIMYPGMSGGPVVDSTLRVVFAVNTAVGDGFIVISPLIGLFETLGVQVIK